MKLWQVIFLFTFGLLMWAMGFEAGKRFNASYGNESISALVNESQPTPRVHIK